MAWTRTTSPPPAAPSASKPLRHPRRQLLRPQRPPHLPEVPAQPNGLTSSPFVCHSRRICVRCCSFSFPIITAFCLSFPKGTLRFVSSCTAARRRVPMHQDEYQFWVYIPLEPFHVLYIGMTNSVRRRIIEHQNRLPVTSPPAARSPVWSTAKSSNTSTTPSPARRNSRSRHGHKRSP